MPPGETRADRRAGAKLRAAGDEAVGDAGPKMPRPSSDSAASTIAMASSIEGVAPPNPG
jgi:hypothetical protein